jgi:hypothetical protein
MESPQLLYYYQNRDRVLKQRAEYYAQNKEMINTRSSKYFQQYYEDNRFINVFKIWHRMLVCVHLFRCAVSVCALIGGTGLDIRSYKEVCKLLGDFLFNAWFSYRSRS